MFAQLPMYQQKGKAALNHKLDKTIGFDSHLNHPHKQFKSIHVGGTNGKGSCSHMMASVLQEAGYKVGLYTSPHLKDFRERIKINGEPASQDYVVQFILEHKDFLEKHQLSFFEMTVGMAFNYFANEKVDIAIIEVGLGGRLDSTNIISPEVCLITNIGLDHTYILGDTYEKIALEKAGIFKRNTPVVIGEKSLKTASIFEMIAAQKKAPIVFAEDFLQSAYQTDLLGGYQERNVKSAVATLKQLKGFYFSEQHLADGLTNVVENTGLLGRWQQLGSNPKVICDTAHNKEGLELVLSQLANEKVEKVHFVIGFVADKNVDDLLKLFPTDGIYYFTAPKISRALDNKVLAEKAEHALLRGNKYPSVIEGLNKAKSKAGSNDIIFVGGSTFVVAEAI
nr:folylpolyglutamate synthase/dihydrofolate synthase family protein [Croceivirga thetidis]